MLSRLSVMKTHMDSTFEHLRIRGWISAYVFATILRTCGYIVACPPLSLSLPSFSFSHFRSTLIELHLASIVPYPRLRLPNAIDEIWGVSNYAIGARPIKLPSCRRSPSPLSRSARKYRLTLFRLHLPEIFKENVHRVCRFLTPEITFQPANRYSPVVIFVWRNSKERPNTLSFRVEEKKKKQERRSMRLKQGKNAGNSQAHSSWNNVPLNL